MKTTTIRVSMGSYRTLAALSRRTGITLVYLANQAIEELAKRMNPQEPQAAQPKEQAPAKQGEAA